jgi:hypothetical protein
MKNVIPWTNFSLDKMANTTNYAAISSVFSNIIYRLYLGLLSLIHIFMKNREQEQETLFFLPEDIAPQTTAA